MQYEIPLVLAIFIALLSFSGYHRDRNLIFQLQTNNEEITLPIDLNQKITTCEVLRNHGYWESDTWRVNNSCSLKPLLKSPVFKKCFSVNEPWSIAIVGDSTVRQLYQSLPFYISPDSEMISYSEQMGPKSMGIRPDTELVYNPLENLEVYLANAYKFVLKNESFHIGNLEKILYYAVFI